MHLRVFKKFFATTGDDYEDEDSYCLRAAKLTVPSSRPQPGTVEVALGVVSGVTLLAAVTSLTLVSLRVWRRRRKASTPYDPLPSPEDGDYPYDVFILCSDQDEGFVKECIESPLKENGYTVVRKNTAPNGLFMLGNPIVADIDHIVRLCSRVIVVCSENYTSTRRCEDGQTNDHCNVEINCCKEMASSNHGRVIPVVLDGAEAAEFKEFTQHRIRTATISTSSKARSSFVKKLERDLNIKR